MDLHRQNSHVRLPKQLQHEHPSRTSGAWKVRSLNEAMEICTTREQSHKGLADQCQIEQQHDLGLTGGVLSTVQQG